MKHLITLFLITVFTSLFAQSDSIILKNGTVHTNILSVINREWDLMIKDYNMKEFVVDKSKIDHIRLGESITSYKGWETYKSASVPALVAALSGDTAISFSGVIKVDSNVTADMLFERAKLWFADYYKDSKEVMQVSDKPAGQLVGKGTFKSYMYTTMGTYGIGHIQVTVKIFTKNGRYKYELTNYVHENTSSGNKYIPSFGIITSSQTCPEHISGFMIPKHKYWNDLQTQVNQNATEMLISLKEYMNKPAPNQSDW